MGYGALEILVERLLLKNLKYAALLARKVDLVSMFETTTAHFFFAKRTRNRSTSMVEQELKLFLSL